MATRDTGGQSQSGKSRQDEEIEDVTAEANPEVAERHAEITEDVDDLLDEIDSVLEENAEEFVRGYVQKGGAVSVDRSDRARARPLAGAERPASRGARLRPTATTIIAPAACAGYSASTATVVSASSRADAAGQAITYLRGTTWQRVLIHPGVYQMCSPTRGRPPSRSS